MAKSQLGWILFISMGLMACGTNKPGRQDNPTDPQKKYTLQGEEYLLLEAGSLQFENDSLTGTGKLLFKEPRPEDDNRFTLNFSLKDAGGLMLTSNASASLEKGVNVHFERKAAALSIVLSAGSETYDLSSDFASANPQEPLSIAVEIHGHGHVIMLIGTERGEYAFSTRVAGKLWGLSLKDALVTKATASKATEGH